MTDEWIAIDGPILILHDTTTLDFSTHHALQGKGPVGDGDGTGFLQHNSLAFRPDGGRLLGLVHQQFTVRQPAPDRESAAARKSRQGRESLLWSEGITAPRRDGLREGRSGSMSATAAPTITRPWPPRGVSTTSSCSASARTARCS